MAAVLTVPAEADAQRALRPAFVALLGAAVLAAFVAGLALGAYRIAPADVLRALAAPFARGADGLDAAANILWAIRLPRVLLAALIGAALAMAGCAMQGLFRNPLADPGLIGIASGAALAAAVAIVAGSALFGAQARTLGLYTVPALAFAGALAAAVLIFGLASRAGRTSVLMMLLAGIAVNALAAAGIGVLVYLANDEQLRSLTFWTLGTLAGARWPVVAAVALAGVAGGVQLWRCRHALDAYALGESAAFQLGVEPQALKRRIVLAVTLMVGVAVAFTGIIGFVGLVAPHAVRLVIGPAHRHVLGASALLGAALVMAADTVARVAVAPAELPIGVLTALLGAPMFLLLLRRQRRMLAGD